MQEPEFIGGDVDLRINIYRSYVDTPNGENDAKSSLNDAKNEENDAKMEKTTPKMERTTPKMEKTTPKSKKNYGKKKDFCMLLKRTHVKHKHIMRISLVCQKEQFLECLFLYEKRVS